MRNLQNTTSFSHFPSSYLTSKLWTSRQWKITEKVSFFKLSSAATLSRKGVAAAETHSFPFSSLLISSWAQVHFWAPSDLCRGRSCSSALNADNHLLRRGEGDVWPGLATTSPPACIADLPRLWTAKHREFWCLEAKGFVILRTQGYNTRFVRLELAVRMKHQHGFALAVPLTSLPLPRPQHSPLGPGTVGRSWEPAQPSGTAAAASDTWSPVSAHFIK